MIEEHRSVQPSYWPLSSSGLHLLVAAITGQKKKRASVYPIALDSGSMSTFKFPPTMFMTNRKNPRTEVRTALGKISTMAMKRMPNHVSAKISKVG